VLDTRLIRTLVVDDEPLARARISELLSTDPDIQVIGECANGREAVAAMRQSRPDLVFLDVEMPEADGLTVLSEFAAADLPSIVFVTAYDQYAVRAFDFHAIDYLLKPFDKERFERALRRAKTSILTERSGELGQRILSALDEIRTKPAFLERLVIKNNGHVFFLKAEEINWIEAEGNYVRIHTNKESHLLRDTISALEAQLNPGKFLRVHRSAIVNIDRIQELHSWFHGEYRIILNDGSQLTLSRTYRDRLTELLGRPL
jgi:two-component system, LytTR family, response regulator